MEEKEEQENENGSLEKGRPPLNRHQSGHNSNSNSNFNSKQRPSPSPLATPSEQSQPPSRSEGILDPINALSKRSRSNTDGFFSPLVSSVQEMAVSSHTGPLDDVKSDPASAYLHAFHRPASDSGESSEQCTASYPASSWSRASQQAPEDLSAYFSPSQPPYSATSLPDKVSSQTNQDLSRLFSSYGHGHMQFQSVPHLGSIPAFSKPSPVKPNFESLVGVWPRRERQATSSAMSSSSAFGNEPPSSDSAWEPFQRAPNPIPPALSSRLDPRFYTFPGLSSSSTRDIPLSVQEKSVRFNRHSHTVTATDPDDDHPQVQTEETEFQKGATSSHNLRMLQYRTEIERLYTENQLLKLHLFDIRGGVGLPTAGSSYGSGRGLNELGYPNGLDSSMFRQDLPTARDAGSRFLSSAIGGFVDPYSSAMGSSGYAGFEQTMTSMRQERTASNWPSAAPTERATLRSQATVSSDMPALLNQQRMLAALGLGLPEGRSGTSSARTSSPYTTSAPENIEAIRSSQGATPSNWPTLTESQQQQRFAQMPLSDTGEVLSTLSEESESNIDPNKLINQILEGRGQEASIALQQHLKTGSPELKSSIIRAVQQRLLALAQDRHGNFLVQRAIGVEPELVWNLKGHFVQLAVSHFGCHVVQRVLDEDERIRGVVVEELLTSRLEETLTSRNSVHVWQKVLELNWTHPEFRRTIFAIMNQQMKGKWAQAARQETGSIICQNIFESADTDEKRDCLNEVLDQAEECASNQWGVWVIQHIIEHGAEEERKAALNRLLKGAVRLTLSQFGQKAIMSGLKSGDDEFAENYVNLLCDNQQNAGGGSGSSTGSRRSALVDVALAPQGLQIVTQLLTSVPAEVREKIISTVRKNSVFLKGSKTGLKVHQLCERARAFSGY